MEKVLEQYSLKALVDALALHQEPTSQLDFQELEQRGILDPWARLPLPNPDED